MSIKKGEIITTTTTTKKQNYDDRKFEEMMRNGEYLTDIMDCGESGGKLFKEFTKQEVSGLRNRLFDVASVENCIIQLAYFYRSLYLYDAKIQYKGVVFTQGDLDQSKKILVIKVGYVVNHTLNQRVTAKDLIEAIQNIFLCTKSFYGMELNVDLIDFKTEYEKSKKNPTIDKMLGIFQRTNLFLKKSKLLKIAHYSVMFRYLGMKKELRESLMLVKESNRGGQQNSGGQIAGLRSLTMQAETFFSNLGFKVFEMASVRANQRKFEFSPVLTQCYQKIRPRSKEQMQLRERYEVELNSQTIDITLITPIEYFMHHSDILMFNGSQIEIDNMNVNMHNKQLVGKRYICFKVELQAKEYCGQELRYNLLSALDTLLVIGIVFESFSMKPYEHNQILEEIYHYIKYTKALTEELYFDPEHGME